MLTFIRKKESFFTNIHLLQKLLFVKGIGTIFRGIIKRPYESSSAVDRDRNRQCRHTTATTEYVFDYVNCISNCCRQFSDVVELTGINHYCEYSFKFSRSFLDKLSIPFW